MRINLAKSAGFCFGVKRAISIAFDQAGSRKKLYMLGDIVHNEEVVRQINASGIKKIEKLSRGQGKTLLIRAHGAAQKTIQGALNLGYNIIDATCPMVKEIHKITKEAEAKGYKIIVIGDKEHDEVKGIIGQLKTRAIVIEGLKNIPQSVSRIKKAAVIVQSTQNTQKALEIVEALKPKIKKLEFFNTICRPTRLKQGEIKKLPLENDVMIIIGSKNSANTKRLYEISRSLNEKSFWVGSRCELKNHWFKNAKTVGITAGASTPENTIQEIIRHIENLPHK